jgi:DNA-binding SARP family transcriptional activator/Tfp pilus assembly protein PilF
VTIPILDYCVAGLLRSCISGGMMSKIEQNITFQILGPLRVHTEAGELAISAVRERTVLAMLLLHPSETIATWRLVEAVWGDEPPRNVRNQLQGCVSRLRKQLASIDRQIIVTTTQGYQIDVEPQTVDLLRFRQIRDEARTAARDGDRERARDRYRIALRLWRGSPLSDIDSPLVRRIAEALDEERAYALEERVEIDLALGGAGELVAELTALVEQYPYREALHGALMRALYRAGRQTEALAAYRRVLLLLREEFGTEPGADLQQLHQAILRQDPALKRVPLAPPVTVAPLIPRQLPPDVGGFAGRFAALEELDKLLPDGDMVAPTPVVISAIAGTAGVGKTALAVHWAHRVADRFPDGQLYINLSGFDPARPPVEPAEALRGFLDALQVPPEWIPVGLDARIGLFRSLLAGRRMLVVLDSARDVDQVRPLLPAAAGCMVLVTSRNLLLGLVTDGAHPLRLGVLPRAEARLLLVRRVGAERLTADPGAAEEIITRCAQLPLALAVVAARAATRPDRSLSSVATELREAYTALDALSEPDPAIDIRAALDMSYRTLAPEAAHLYRLLGLHPGPDFEPYAAATLVGATPVRARRLLERLLDAHLLQEHVPGRYAFHDLLRSHARDTAAAHEAEADRQSALTHLFDYYRSTLSIAMDFVHPYDRERRPRVPHAPALASELSDPTRATEWLDSELPNVLAVALYAAGHGWPEHTLHLSTLLHQHLARGRYHDAEVLHRLALTTARSAGNRVGELDALIGLGRINRRQARYEQALERYGRALELARAIGNRTGELEALVGFGDIDRLQGRHEQGIIRFGQVLKLAREIGNRVCELDAHTAIGHIHWRQSRHDKAADHYLQALELARAIGHHTGEIHVLTGLGNIHQMQGRYEQAIDYYHPALEVARATSHRAGEANVLISLGNIHRRRGEYGPAMDYYQPALDIARAAGDRAGELHALGGLGYIHRRQRQSTVAADHYQRILTIAREMGDQNWQFEALQGLGRLHQAAGRGDLALDRYTQALGLATELGQDEDQARAHEGLACAHYSVGQSEPARRHWEWALEILARRGVEHTDDEEANVHAIRAHLTDLDQR